MTDNEIITNIKDGTVRDCEIAFRQLYKSQYKMIETFVLRNSGTLDDVQDVFQETVISLYNNIKEDKYSPQSMLSTYLFAICKNIWFNSLRKNGRVSLIENKEFDNNPSDEDIESIMEYTELQQQIGELLHSVGQECATVLKLFYFERIKMLKIALKMNYSTEQEAKNKKYKCMKKLKAIVLNSDKFKEALRSYN